MVPDTLLHQDAPSVNGGQPHAEFQHIVGVSGGAVVVGGVVVDG